MNFKIFGTALAAFGFAREFVLCASGRHTAPRLQGRVHPVVAYYNWTGFYVGINGGYGWGTSDWSAVPTANNKPKGWLAGGTIGYNYQIGSIVWGLEGDFDWSNVKGSVACAPAVTCEHREQLARHVPRPGRLRLRPLAAVHHRRRRLRQRQGDRQLPAVGFAVSSSSNQLGWTVGAVLNTPS